MSHLTNFAQTIHEHVQSEPIDSTQVVNNVGGYVYEVSKINRVRRFIILGTEGGTYYVKEKEMTKNRATMMINIFQNEPTEFQKEVINLVVDISVNNKAPKNDTAIFTLALATVFSTNLEIKTLAWESISKVCRIPTHLFQLIEFTKQLSTKPKWGRLPRRSIANWYNKQNPLRLSYQMTKYKNRNNWTHRDLLRLAHIHPETELHSLLFRYVVKGWESIKPEDDMEIVSVDDPLGENPVLTETKESVVSFLGAVEFTMKEPKIDMDETHIVDLIKKHRLAREHLNTNYLTLLPVWTALLADMPLTAMIRNLSVMTSKELLTESSEETLIVVRNLAQIDKLKAARVHPFTILLALYQYKQGHGLKGSLSWNPVKQIITALESAFYLAFQLVEPTNKRFLIGLDVSGSMGCQVMGSSITCNAAAAAMSMLVVRTEPKCDVMAFSSTFMPVNLTKTDTLETVIKKTGGLPFAGTDCSLPMVWAKKNKKNVDVFVVYTDCETYSGKIHPMEALRKYRKETGIDAKLIVVGMTATNFTIADPKDKGSLDIAGFDSSTPQIISDFVLGNI